MDPLYRLIAPVPRDAVLTAAESPRLMVGPEQESHVVLRPRPIFRDLLDRKLEIPEDLQDHAEVVFDDVRFALAARNWILQRFESRLGEDDLLIEEISCRQSDPGTAYPSGCDHHPDFDPPAALEAGDPRSVQWYLDDKSRGGVDHATARRREGWQGTGVELAVLDISFDSHHRDLPTPPRFLWGACEPGCRECHGTWVLGILAGAGGVGLQGLCPDVDVRLAPLACKAEELESPENACWNLLATLTPGSVVLVEREVRIVLGEDRLSPWLPLESLPLARRVMKMLSQQGIYVVQAAGNGNADLHSWVAPRGGEPDSGSILVGASCPWQPERRTGDSNYGSRIDVNAWGDRVVTTEGGSGCRPQPVNTRYFADFGGTSAASAIVAGMVASLSGIWKKRFGSALAPRDMRQVISHSSWGSKHSGIGLRPNFPEALQALDDLAQKHKPPPN